ncbi:hypothetical protein ACOMHN_004104 [Nucella lapillus]
MKRVESEAGRECEEKEIGDSYCTDGPTGPEGGEVSSEETNEEGGEGEGDRGLVDGGREAVSKNQEDHPTSAAMRNVLSNVKQDIIPYDHSRVRLTYCPLPNSTNDYINASYIDVSHARLFCIPTYRTKTNSERSVSYQAPSS